MLRYPEGFGMLRYPEGFEMLRYPEEFAMVRYPAASRRDRRRQAALWQAAAVVAPALERKRAKSSCLTRSPRSLAPPRRGSRKFWRKKSWCDRIAQSAQDLADARIAASSCVNLDRGKTCRQPAARARSA